MTPDDLIGCLTALSNHHDPDAMDLAWKRIFDAFTKPGGFWPDAVMEAVATHVSPSVWNPESRTFKGLDKRICHTIAVWRNRYGPLTVEQEEYMSDLLVWAVTSAAKEAGGDKKKLYPFIHTRIGNLVNHETVHDGFKKRAVATVDVSAMLAAA